jgi:3-hydroxyacyl-[acyl-carrier-protein] dehydratase
VGIDGARFKRQVVPGDVLLLEVEILNQKRDIVKYKAQARVGNEIACVCEIMCARREI